MPDTIEIMGIVNVTPDSFSDGGLYLDPEKAVAHGLKLLQEGATILDIGGESTRPGAEAVPVDAEIARVIPVIAALAEPVRAHGATVSIDTRNAKTMRLAVQGGAGMINDVSALTHDPDSLATAAATDCRVVLMHMHGTPQTMQTDPHYKNVVTEVRTWLADRLAVAIQAGIAANRLVIDPGIGFGKTPAHNLALLRGLPELTPLAPVMVGLSRKQFIARLSQGETADHRLGGSIAGALFALAQGAAILRVHDVAETVQAVRLWEALCGS